MHYAWILAEMIIPINVDYKFWLISFFDVLSLCGSRRWLIYETFEPVSNS